jgi:glutathione peroxidase
MTFFSSAAVVAQDVPKNFYDFKMKTIDGGVFDFAQLKGKKVLIVNTASKCGNTPQYAELEKMFKKYGGDKFVILGFPSNDFLSQEPGTNGDIKEFCTKNYGVTFQMFEKIHVKGKEINPLYLWLTKKQYNGIENESVGWNFQKYMIDENGHWAGSVSAFKTPNNDKIINWIKGKNN